MISESFLIAISISLFIVLTFLFPGLLHMIGLPYIFSFLLGFVLAASIVITGRFIVNIQLSKHWIKQMQIQFEKSPDAALQYVNQVLVKHPRFLVMIFYKLLLLASTGDFAAFYSLYTQSVSSQRRSAKIPSYKVIRIVKLSIDFLYNQLNPSELKAVTEIVPSKYEQVHPSVQYNLLDVLTNYVAGQYDTAFEHADIYEKQVQSALYKFLGNYIMGLCKQQLGQPDEAQTYFDKLPEYAINQLTKDLANQYASSQPQG